MSSTDSERSDNILWEHGDSLSNDSICSPVFSKQAVTPSASQITTPGLNSPMDTITLSSQDSTVFFPTSGSFVPRKRGGRPSRKSKFRGNQHTEMTASLDESSGTLPLPTPKAKRFQFTRPRRGYTSRHSTPFPFRMQCTHRTERIVISFMRSFADTTSDIRQGVLLAALLTIHFSQMRFRIIIKNFLCERNRISKSQVGVESSSLP